MNSDAYQCQKLFYPELIAVQQDLLTHNIQNKKSNKENSNDGQNDVDKLNNHSDINMSQNGSTITDKVLKKVVLSHTLPSSEQLPLKRESLITSGANLYFLDSGTDLILYRCIL